MAKNQVFKNVISRKVKINKILGIIIFLSILLLANSVYAEGANSQNRRLSLSLNNTTLKDVFREIEKNSDYIFFYSDEINTSKLVNINVDAQNIEEVMKQLLKGTSYEYTISDRQVFLKTKAASLNSTQQQQKITVTGTVVDAKNGDLLPGVSVTLKSDPKVGVSTDVDGVYSINITQSQNAILIFNYLGYKVAEKQISNQKIVNVALEEDTKTLDEVVVLGYGTQKKGSVIGSVERLDADKLKLPTRTISTSLAGNLAGVIAVQSSGEPGFDAASFWIRGINTFAGGSKPLILVDGVERNLDDVEPEDIADFSILKDATATAVYGVRGANGVVLVTTKKGKVNKPQVSFRAENAFSSPINLPKFADGGTFMKMHNEALVNQGLQEIYSQSRIRNTINKTDPYYYPDVNWLDELIKDQNLYQKATLNVSGGNEYVRYYVSGTFLNQDGMFKHFGGTSYNNNINYKRYNFRTNVDVNTSSRTILNIQVAALQEERKSPNVNMGDLFGWMVNTAPVEYPVNYPDPTKVPGISYGQGRNPYQLLARSGYRDLNITTAQSVFTLNQDLSDITKGLRGKMIFSFDNYRTVNSEFTMRPRPYLAKPFGYDPDSGEPILVNDKGEYNYVDQEPSGTDYYDYLKKKVENNKTDQSIYIEASLNYNRTFGKHNVGGLLLYNQSDKTLPTEEDVYDSVSRRRQGMTGRTTYAFDDKYFFEFNFGYNGSENFAKGHRYGFFPAYAVGWTPTKEDFMNWMKPAITYMKLRTSYGKVGNDDLGGIASNQDPNKKISRFVYLSRVSTTDSNVGFGVNNGYGYGHGKGINVVYYGNPDATWETATKFDAGLEVEFLKGFRLQADYFYEKREDIWVQLERVPDIFGYGNAKPGGNVGSMENKGVDGMIEYSRQVNKDFFFSLKGTFTYAKNKVLSDGRETPKYAYQSYIGRPNGSSLGYIAEGFFIDEAEINSRPSQTALGGKPKPGDLKYKDVNDDGVVDEFDREFIGKSDIPEFTFGAGASMAYKSFDFSFMFQGASGVSFYAKPKLFSQQGRGNVYDFYVDNYWSESTQNLGAQFPRLGTGEQDANFVNSTWWQEDGKYIKLRSIELGYTLPAFWTEKAKIKSVRFYTNGTNLFTFSPFKWWDPESKHSTGLYYPVQKSVNIGLEVKF